MVDILVTMHVLLHLCCGEKVSLFTDYLGTTKLLGEFFYMFMHAWRYTNMVTTGNEGKDMKQQKLFTANKNSIRYVV